MSSRDTETQDPEFEGLIRFIQERRGLDFRGYKRTSLKRRIMRRMEEVGCGGFPGYHAFLEAHPQEFAELLDTVLINVTSFFRDPEGWEVLRTQVVPQIVKAHPTAPIRVWSVGCASGEEPYSLAMLFAEALGIEAFCQRVKIYATDLDEGALRTARQATYPPRDVENVPTELLERFFERTSNHYVVLREIRKCVIFGQHNIVSDAPISRIDLLTCRNLMIYLDTDTQNVVLPRLHYALVNHGYLFLGKAETQLARSKYFEPVDVKNRIFRKVPQEWRRGLSGGVSLAAGEAQGRGVPQARLFEAIVDGSATAYLAVNAENVLIYANAAARRLLEVGEGDIGRPFQDLAISYRPAELRSRIEEVIRACRPVRIEHQDYVRPPADPIRLTVEITPLMDRDGKPIATLLSFADTTRGFQLQQELEAAQESLETTIEELQSANEELETTNEELQSTNEELETTNEELQSTNEELETMNEELRSANEELEVANEELRRHSDEAGAYRRYSEAVLRSIDAGIVVLAQDCRVRSWNRWCENVWGLRADEVMGESLFELDIGLPVHRLRGDVTRVLEGGEAQPELRLEARDRRGREVVCRVRLSPLLVEGGAPTGAVMIVEDVTDQERAEAFSEQIGRVVGKAANEVYFLDPETLRFVLVNQGAERKLGYSLAQLRHMAITELMPGVAEAALRETIGPLIRGEREDVVFVARLQNRAGKPYPAEICLQHFPEERPPVLVAMVHDISERQVLEPVD